MSASDGQKRLRIIARCLAATTRTELSPEDGNFLSAALLEISDGKDANAALGVKAKRGEHKSIQSQVRAQVRKKIKIFALGWIKAAKLSEEEGGYGLTLEKALEKLYGKNLKAFDLTEETLRTYWNKSPDFKTNKFFEIGGLK